MAFGFLSIIPTLENFGTIHCFYPFKTESRNLSRSWWRIWSQHSIGKIVRLSVILLQWRQNPPELVSAVLNQSADLCAALLLMGASLELCIHFSHTLCSPFWPSGGTKAKRSIVTKTQGSPPKWNQGKNFNQGPDWLAWIPPQMSCGQTCSQWQPCRAEAAGNPLQLCIKKHEVQCQRWYITDKDANPK